MVDSGFKKLNQTIPANTTPKTQIANFLCSLIQFLDKNAITTAIPKIAALDNVKIIATIHNIVSEKFISLLGFFKKSFISCQVPHRHSSIAGKKATKKYP